MTQEQKFRNKVNWISIICAVLVVFLHSYAFNDGKQDVLAYHIEFFFSRNIAQSSVPVFFFLSAFLFYRNFQKSKLLTKFKSRISSLIVPYVLWNAISMAAFYFLSKMPFVNTASFDLNPANIIRGLVFYEYNLVFWFVFQLIILTYLFPIFYPILKKKILAAVVFLMMIVVYGSGKTAFGMIEVKAWIFYYFGAYFAVHHQDYIVNRNRISIVGIVAFLLSQYMIYSPYSEEYFVYILTRLLMIIAVFDFVGVLSRWSVPAILNCSFPIYAMHNLILETFNKLFSFVLTPDTNLILIDYFGSTVMTIAIIAVINAFLRKKMPKVHSVLFGGRNG